MNKILVLLLSTLVLASPSRLYAMGDVVVLGKSYEAIRNLHRPTCERQLVNPSVVLGLEPASEALQRRQSREKILRTFLLVLQDAHDKRQPMGDGLLELKKRALLNFRDLMSACFIDNYRLNETDIKNYGRLLNLAVENIFFDNPAGQNPLHVLTPYFYQQISNFGADEKFELLTAVLASVDIGAAMRANPEFLAVIGWWFNTRYAQQKTPRFKEWAETAQARINALAGQIEPLRQYLRPLGQTPH